MHVKWYVNLFRFVTKHNRRRLNVPLSVETMKRQRRYTSTHAPTSILLTCLYYLNFYKATLSLNESLPPSLSHPLAPAEHLRFLYVLVLLVRKTNSILSVRTFGLIVGLQMICTKTVSRTAEQPGSLPSDRHNVIMRASMVVCLKYSNLCVILCAKPWQ